MDACPTDRYLYPFVVTAWAVKLQVSVAAEKYLSVAVKVVTLVTLSTCTMTMYCAVEPLPGVTYDCPPSEASPAPSLFHQKAVAPEAVPVLLDIANEAPEPWPPLSQYAMRLAPGLVKRLLLDAFKSFSRFPAVSPPPCM